jgi:hypothetical protein
MNTRLIVPSPQSVRVMWRRTSSVLCGRKRRVSCGGLAETAAIRAKSHAIVNCRQIVSRSPGVMETVHTRLQHAPLVGTALLQPIESILPNAVSMSTKIDLGVSVGVVGTLIVGRQCEFRSLVMPPTSVAGCCLRAAMETDCKQRPRKTLRVARPLAIK